MAIDLSKIDGAFTIAHELPRPQWDIIQAWVAANLPESAQQEAWCEAQRQWLATLAQSMGPQYGMSESDEVLLCCASPRNAPFIVDLAKESLTAVRGCLGHVWEGHRQGKYVILVFAGEATFWRYVRYFDPEDRPSVAGGMCIARGSVHIAMPSFNGLKQSLAHELAHAYLAGLSPPRWLNEGFAQMIERAVAVRQRLDTGRIVQQAHRAHWRKQGIQGFWSGQAFRHRRANDNLVIAYNLAEILVQRLWAHAPERFGRFLVNAKCTDGAESAAIEVLGQSLGSFAHQVLGDGDWAPQANLSPDDGMPLRHVRGYARTLMHAVRQNS